jgi:hypothetical protein
MNGIENFIITQGAKLPVCTVKNIVIQLLTDSAARTKNKLDDLAVDLLKDTIDFLLPECKESAK